MSLFANYASSTFKGGFNGNGGNPSGSATASSKLLIPAVLDLSHRKRVMELKFCAQVKGHFPKIKASAKQK